ncbi:MAG: efflux RND transporter periplasmic adaptor subunit [Proteobacteria bacterium]|nr:efflux RND transporter periplasmic adaptor subunit [Pseudomonadota bacterium]
MLKKVAISLVLFLFFFSATTILAEEAKKSKLSKEPAAVKKGPPGAGKRAMPPAIVVLGDVREGEIAPESDFIGTVYFEEVSELAAEVRGKVLTVRFDEGQEVKAQEALVTLDSALLSKEIEEVSATHGQATADLERAESDFKRIEKLFKEGFVSEQDYDENFFNVQGLRKQVASLWARYEGLKVELDKKVVRAPFTGIVLKRDVDRGEWIEVGKTVATIAKTDSIDIVVQVPEFVVRNIKTGLRVAVTAGGKKLKGKITAIVPSGDIRTRTFPVKIRVNNSASLIEGMEARVSLPTGKKESALIVDRDAVIKKFGKEVIFVVEDGKARMLPVTVIGYTGNKVGVSAKGLRSAMMVVTKGNERINDGQAVTTGKKPKK